METFLTSSASHFGYLDPGIGTWHDTMTNSSWFIKDFLHFFHWKLSVLKSTAISEWVGWSGTLSRIIQGQGTWWVVRKAAFDSLNLLSGFEEDKKRVDSHQEMPNSCPHLEENTDYDTIPYSEVSPFPHESSFSSHSLWCQSLIPHRRWEVTGGPGV